MPVAATTSQWVCEFFEEHVKKITHLVIQNLKKI